MDFCNFCTWLLWSPAVYVVYTWVILFYDLNKIYITYWKKKKTGLFLVYNTELLSNYLYLKDL